jgi:glyoxylase-like metal-dependent hydrolase (beta-lactamase superfamily II)
MHWPLCKDAKVGRMTPVMKPEGGTLMKPAVFALFVAALAPVSASADVLTVHSVAAGVWAVEGPAAQRDPENLGNNATFGLVETDAGAILIDPGGTWNGAEALHALVRSLTDQPVTHVINTGGQDHRWLGNSYWQALGATVIASDAAVEDQRTRGSLQMTMLSQLVGDGFSGTEPAYEVPRVS